MRSLKAIRHQLLSINCINRHHITRNYRFGNRAVKNAWYYSAQHEANLKYLQIDKPVKSEILENRNELFDKEKKRQSDLVARVEKIEVNVLQPFPDAETVTLFMNKDISTPYNCAQHIHQLLTENSVLAKIEDSGYWEMHRPLTSDCTLKFRHFKEIDTIVVNLAFFRSCSFILGMIIEKAFKDEIDIYLHSWPGINLKSGSFIYDTVIALKNWCPKEEEMRVLTSMAWKICEQKLNFERLDVSEELALQIFEHNKFKTEQIKTIFDSKRRDSLTLYRVGDHIDFSSGPMIANTSQIGSFFVSAVHPIETDIGLVYRFQGIAIPKQLNINSFAFSVLRENAKKLNRTIFHSLYIRKPKLFSESIADQNNVIQISN